MERTRLGELCWVELSAKDMEAQSEFYERLFGWSHLDVPTDAGSIYRMFQMDGVTVAGASPLPAEAEAAGARTAWNAHFATPDVDAVAARVEPLGGRTLAPPMDAMRWGRIAGFTDPTGAMAFLWQRVEVAGGQRFGEPGSLVWADLNTTDPERAGAFFGELLGWDVQRAEQSETPYWTASVFGTPQVGIAPIPASMPEGTPPSWLVYFGVADTGAAADAARDLGGHVEMEPADAGVTVYSLVRDPAGAEFGVMTPLAGM